MTKRSHILVLAFVLLSASVSSAAEENGKFGREAGFFLGFGFGVAGQAAFIPVDERLDCDAALVFNVGKIFNSHFMLGGEIAHQGILAVGYYQMGVMSKIYPSTDLGLFLKVSGGFAFYDPLDLWGGHSEGENGGGFRASVGWDFHQIGNLFGMEVELGYGVLFLSGKPHGGHEENDDNYKIDILTGLITFSIYGKERGK